MGKRFLSVLILFLLAFSMMGAKEIIDFQHDARVLKSANRNAPYMSYNYDRNSTGTLLLNAPASLVSFFTENGIDPQYLTKECCEIPYEVKMQMSEICLDCDEDFCCAIESAVAPYEGIYYSSIVLKVGDVYWTVLT